MTESEELCVCVDTGGISAQLNPAVGDGVLLRGRVFVWPSVVV